MTLTNGTFSKTLELELNRDSWIVALVRGDKSLFPMVPPKDVPAFLLGDAFSSLAGPFGFSDGPLTPMSPKRNGFSKPLALTNPIWVNVDGNDTFNAPGTQPRVCEDYGVVMEDPAARSGGLNKKIRRRPRRGTLRNSYGFPRVHGDMLDIRAIFEGHLGHTHPH
jgi:hypothetical protein